MKPLFSAGDLVFSQKTDVDLLEVGDVITFVSRDPLTFGENITHQIHAIGMDEGVVVFTTKGTNLDTVDQTSIFEQQINGKYWFSIPKVGYFVDFMRSNTGFIVIFILPISLLVVLEGLHFTKLYKKYVKESLMSEMSIVNGKHVDLEKLKKALEMIEEDQKNQSKIMD
jgi:signal peptidase I